MTNPQTDAEIQRLYAAAFNRTPDTVGLAYWDAAADNGLSVPQIAGFFTASPEFIQDYGQLNDWQFVEQLYQNVLGRHGDAAGATYWHNALATGDTRGNVLNDFAQSPENILHTAMLAAPPVASPPVALPPATPPPASTPVITTPAPPPDVVTPPADPAPLPNQTITGVQTINTPAAFLLQTATRNDTSTLITTHANADASNFTFSGYGGQVELSDLQFNGFIFKSNYVPDPTVIPPITGLGFEEKSLSAGGKFILTENETQVGSISVISSNAAQSTYFGTDANTGYSFIHSG